MSQCAGPNGRVVSIEGTPNNYKVLLKNIQLNDLDNVIAYNYFITNEPGQVWFKPDENHPYEAIGRLQRQDDHPSPDSVIVPAGPLFLFLEEIQFRPDYLFMDIEGFEAEVFEDFSAGYFRVSRPMILFEIHEQFYKPPKDLAFIENVLDQNDYYYRRVGHNLLCFPPSKIPQQPNSLGPDSDTPVSASLRDL